MKYIIVLLLCVSSVYCSNLLDAEKLVKNSGIKFDAVTEKLSIIQQIQKSFDATRTFFSSFKRYYAGESYYDEPYYQDSERIAAELADYDDINIRKLRMSESDSKVPYIDKHGVKHYVSPVAAVLASHLESRDNDELLDMMVQYLYNSTAFLDVHPCGIFGQQTFMPMTLQDCVNVTVNGTTTLNCTTVTYNGSVCVCPVDWKGENCMEFRPYKCKLIKANPAKCAAYPDKYDQKMHLTDGIAPCNIHSRSDDIELKYNLDCFFLNSSKEYPAGINVSAYNFTYVVNNSNGFALSQFMDTIFVKSNVLNMYHLSRPITKQVPILPEHMSNLTTLIWTIYPKTMSDAYFAGGRIHLEVILSHENLAFFLSYYYPMYKENVADVMALDFEMDRSYGMQEWHHESLSVWWIIAIIMGSIVLLLLVLYVIVKVVRKVKAKRE